MAGENKYDMFLYVEGASSGWIKGETKDIVHPSEIEVLSYSHGVSNSSKSAGGSGDWKPDFADISMVIEHGRASPILMAATASGAPIKRIVLSIRKSGTKKSGPANGDYFQMAWHKCLISSFQHNNAGPSITETIGFTFQAVETFYAQQNEDGTLGDTVQRNWHVGENKDMQAQHLPFKNPNAK